MSAAVEVRAQLDLDHVLLVVAGEPWQKLAEHPVTSAAHRLELTRRAAEGLPGLVVDDREVRREGPSYTVDTVRSILAEVPDAEVVVILGADAAAGLGSWERGEELAALAIIAVIPRPGHVAGDVPPGFRTVHVAVPHLAVSSTDIRQRVADGRPIDVLVPAATVTWMAEHRLYCSTG